VGFESQTWDTRFTLSYRQLLLYTHVKRMPFR